MRLKRKVAAWDDDFLLSLIALYAYSDEAGHLFRAEAGHRTDLKPAIIPG
jgi:hypothetical protein